MFKKNQTNNKKPIWKKWWFWLIIIFVIIIIIPSEDKEKKENKSTPQQSSSEIETNVDKKDFSFDDYIQIDKIREYEIIKEDDLSTLALDGRLSDYTSEEIASLPVNIRKEYRIVVPIDITKEELESTIAKLIKDKAIENPDIDEIVIFVYDSKEKIDGAYTLGKAEWCPNGEWAGVTQEIAKNNIRDSYKIVYNIKEEMLELIKKAPEVLYGLTESERKEIFIEIVKCDDWADAESLKKYYPGCESCSEFIKADIYKYADEVSELTNSCRKELRNKYNIIEETRSKISTEGVIKRWPMPEGGFMPSCCK